MRPYTAPPAPHKPKLSAPGAGGTIPALAFYFPNGATRMPDDRTTPRVGVIMGSTSDWATMQHAAEVLEKLGIPFEVKVVSAHRTPDLLFDYAEAAEGRGLEVVIAGAGGAAHLPGMCASKTVLPVLGVPVESAVLRGVDSLLSIAQMPAGVPVGTLAIGKAGAANAALLAAAILALKTPAIREALRQFRAARTQEVLDNPDPRA
jgi:5-(carboxyamino)imidazole ribonucleotide mutase